jgi:hypothetical protein
MQSTKPENQVEEKKLAIYAAAKREIGWRRSGNLGPEIKFSHKVHIVEAELDCKDCHGNIAQTDTLPKKPAFPYTHALCGQCHDVEKKKPEAVAAKGDAVGAEVTEGSKVDCRMCHPH